jgi:hypothetical protein
MPRFLLHLQHLSSKFFCAVLVKFLPHRREHLIFFIVHMLLHHIFKLADFLQPIIFIGAHLENFLKYGCKTCVVFERLFDELLRALQFLYPRVKDVSLYHAMLVEFISKGCKQLRPSLRVPIVGSFDLVKKAFNSAVVLHQNLALR